MGLWGHVLEANGKRLRPAAAVPNLNYLQKDCVRIHHLSLPIRYHYYVNNNQYNHHLIIIYLLSRSQTRHFTSWTVVCRQLLL